MVAFVDGKKQGGIPKRPPNPQKLRGILSETLIIFVQTIKNAK